MYSTLQCDRNEVLYSGTMNNKICHVIHKDNSRLLKKVWTKFYLVFKSFAEVSDLPASSKDSVADMDTLARVHVCWPGYVHQPGNTSLCFQQSGCLWRPSYQFQESGYNGSDSHVGNSIGSFSSGQPLDKIVQCVLTWTGIDYLVFDLTKPCLMEIDNPSWKIIKWSTPQFMFKFISRNLT